MWAHPTTGRVSPFELDGARYASVESFWQSLRFPPAERAHIAAFDGARAKQESEAMPYGSHIVYGVGFSGNGVAPAVVGGKILASLALGVADEWSGCGLVDGRQGRFPPEPVRFIGAHVVREGFGSLVIGTSVACLPHDPLRYASSSRRRAAR